MESTNSYIPDINKSIEILKQGGIILYPTDTIWGIGCDATNESAVDKIYKLKQRSDQKSMLILLDNPNKISSYVQEMPEIAWDLIDLTEKPLTIIYSGAKNLAKNLIPSDESIGIRITKDLFTQRLISRFGKPIVSTSANISGELSPENYLEINSELINAVDYTVKWRQDDLIKAEPSGIIKLKPNGEVQIIRK
ncbi:MAG: threonylcarbamoyl-AMP synthase [Bacteroidales bacterium]|nr:threonylcarbamoyl-AMP synthase [Bacteroidales bacterium]